MKARILGLMTSGTILSLAAVGHADTTAPQTQVPQVVSAAAAMVEVVSPAVADKAGRDLLRDPDMRRAGSGTEGSVTSTYIDKATGKQYLVAVFMQSADREVHPAHAHMTIRCASYEFQDTEAPKLIANNEIQAEEGRRTAHRPAIPERIVDAKGRFPLFYGNDVNQNSPSTYVKIVDYKCNLLSSSKRVSVSYGPEGAFPGDDANSGAVTYVQSYVAPNGQTRYITQYLATNGNVDTLAEGSMMADDDIAYAINGTIDDNNNWIAEWPDVDAAAVTTYTHTDDKTDPPTVTTYTIPRKTNPIPMIEPADIGRGAHQMVMLDDKRFALCTPYGNNRPSDSIECVVGLAQSGKVLWRGQILKGDENNINYRHWNQVTVSNFGQNRLAIHALAGNGAGKNTNMKGSSIGETFVFDVQGDSLVQNSKIRGAAIHQPHSSICTGKRGVEGQEEDSIGVISAGFTGIGRGAITFLHYDQQAKVLSYNETKDRAPTSWFADSQQLANYYGENPMEQGRDFPKCLGDVPNPSYGKDKGWMKDVKSFFVAGVHGRQPGFSRNAFWVSLVPAVTKYPIGNFTNPVISTEAVTAPPAGPTTSAPPASSDNGGGCACSTPGQTSSSSFAGGLLLLGLAIGGIAARRRS